VPKNASAPSVRPDFSQFLHCLSFQATVFEVADRTMVAVDYAAPKGRTLSQAEMQKCSCWRKCTKCQSQLLRFCNSFLIVCLAVCLEVELLIMPGDVNCCTVDFPLRLVPGCKVRNLRKRNKSCAGCFPPFEVFSRQALPTVSGQFFVG
jgi:hypothetical protein